MLILIINGLSVINPSYNTRCIGWASIKLYKSCIEKTFLRLLLCNITVFNWKTLLFSLRKVIKTFRPFNAEPRSGWVQRDLLRSKWFADDASIDPKDKMSFCLTVLKVPDETGKNNSTFKSKTWQRMNDDVTTKLIETDIFYWMKQWKICDVAS